MIAALEKNQQAKITDWTQCWFGDTKKTGYVAVTDFCFQKSYGLKDIHVLEKDTEGKESRYISLNGFTFGKREIGELKQIRNIGIDLDQYKKDLSIEEGLDALQALIVEQVIPEPNLVLTSRGIQIFYTLENGASPDISWLSSFITDQYIGKLRHIGADSNAKDLSRVMRVPNSINERNRAVVKPEIWNPYPYTLEELQTYCKPLDRFKYKGKKKADIRRIVPKNLCQFHKTNIARLRDLDHLITLRNGDFSEMRNIFLYIYAYHQALVCSSLEGTEAFVYDVYERIHSRTDKPMTERELGRTIRSAYEDSMEFFEHYKENDFKVVYKPNDGIIKPYKTTSLIEKLAITEEEQRALTCLHTGTISKEKDTVRKREERRAAGIRPMEEYNKQRKGQANRLLETVQSMCKEGLKKAEIADKLGISRNHVYRLLKEQKSVT